MNSSRGQLQGIRFDSIEFGSIKMEKRETISSAANEEKKGKLIKQIFNGRITVMKNCWL